MMALAVAQAEHTTWLGFVVAAVPVCACFGLGVWLILETVRPDPEDDGGDHDDGEGGGGGRRGPRRPEPRPSLPDDPEWWPQFERDFAEYLNTRRDTTRLLRTGS